MKCISKLSNSKSLMLIALSIAFLMLLTACSNEPDEEENETPEYAFVTEFTDLLQQHEGIHFAGSAVIIGETLYFSAVMQEDVEEKFSTNMLFSVNLDGTNLIELSNYATTTAPPADADAGYTTILAMAADNEGNLWVVESAEFYIENLPDNFEPDPNEPFAVLEYRESLISSVFVRKLDYTGAEIESIEINEVIREQGFVWIRSFAIDDENIYLAFNEKIAIYNYSGNLTSTLDVDGMITSLINLSNGDIAVSFWGSSGSILQRVDTDRRILGEVLESTQQLIYSFSGNDDYNYFISDQNNLHGFDADAGELVQVLSLIDNSISSDNMLIVSITGDDQVLIISRGWDNHTERSKIELISLTRTTDFESDVTTITFATFFLGWDIREEIIKFNRTNNQYNIQVTDYYEYLENDDWAALFLRITTEIIAGNIPDILDISGLPVEQYVEMGLLEDLYPFIDNDPEINREDFLENLLLRSEINDGLYYVFPLFTLSTIIGNPNVLGSEHGWNIDEFLAVLEKNPGADLPMGAWMTSNSFLYWAVIHNMDFFIDRDAGTVNFDNEDFIKLLETARLFPTDYPDFDSIDERDDIATGRQIMTEFYFSGFAQYQMYREFFGGEVVLKGFPSESRTGNIINPFPTFAITSGSENKEGAWSFISSLLTESKQRQMVTESPNNIPTNKVVLDEMLEKAMNEPERTVSLGTSSGGVMSIIDVTVYPLTQDEKDRLLEMLSSARVLISSDDILTSIMEIVSETASDYFSGQTTAENAARIIQSRASILASEQFG